MGTHDRTYWLKTMCRIADPVLLSLSVKQLKKNMPVAENRENRNQYASLEALGRTLAGIAPWLETGESIGEEGLLKEKYAGLARLAIDAGTNPDSPDFMNFDRGDQPLVDAAFLAHAVLRAPVQLWEKLDSEVKRNLVKALKAIRTRKPHFMNWLLFSAMVEAALYAMGEDWDPMRVDYALKQHEQWYKGDGIYGDGPDFHWDYYNSFVIQPMMIDILSTVGDQESDWSGMLDTVLERARRYAAIQERMISPEGTFPAIGRSLVYRFGVFQHLAQMALRNELPAEISPAQVRCALTAVIRRMIDMPGTFDEQGWLKSGFCGYQPELAETYISTGSLYLCLTVFLPLGLPANSPFWQGRADWTARKLWAGGQTVIDRAISV